MSVDNSQEPQNPYAVSSGSFELPKASVSVGGVPEDRKVKTSHAVDWLKHGFSLFRKSPGMWILSLIILMLITIVLSVIPMLGQFLVNLFFPAFIGGLMMACQALEQGEEMEIEHLFSGFNTKLADFAILGLFYMLASFAIMLVAGALVMVMLGGAGMGAMMGMMTGNSQAVEALMVGGLGLGLALIVLVVLGLSIPLMMAIWFAPALLAFHEIKPLHAMRLSFFACLKNFVPFLLYGLLTLLLSIVATIPLLLGWLVLGPVLVAGIYAAYRDIFVPTP